MLDWAEITRLNKEGRLPRPGAAPLAEQPRKLRRALQVNDTHGRFVDTSAWAAVLELLRVEQFDTIIANGDMLDFYELSRFAKDPSVEEPIERDIEAGRSQIKDLRVFNPDADIHFCPGNHEHRYELYLRSDAKKLSGLKVLELPQLLGLDELGVTAHQRDGFELAPGFRAYHGEVVRKHAGWSALGELEKWGTSGASGHTHRLGVVSQVKAGGRLIWGEGGCLCHLDPEYVTGTPNWQHGCLVIYYSPDGVCWIEKVPIIRGQLLWQGELLGPSPSSRSLAA